MVEKRLNIKDVARSAGVHASTVSRVLNPETRSMVSAEVTEKVLRIAAELGYRRNPLASGLRTRRSMTVGVLIPDLSNPVFPPIVRGIERALGAEGYTSILADSDNDAGNNCSILEKMKARHVDGLIMATAHRKDPVVEECIQQDIPFVLVNRTVDGQSVMAVINNDESGIRLALTHLLELGHQRIAYVGGPQTTSTGYIRYRAFLATAQAADLKIDRDLIGNARGFSELAGYQCLCDILKNRKRFTAVVSANDLLALGCYDALKEKGLRCPEDVSVTGFNDMPFVNRFAPPLTTLHIPHYDLGVQAAQLLLERIREPDKAAKTIKLEPRLVVRHSTAVPPKRRAAGKTGR
ncbi:MAG: LacI family DNA-binding transcriptional regulator [Gammaproteobacteria bacterium]